MAVIGTIAAAVGEMAKAFGNITGVIENNIRSATSISDLSRERGVLSAAESLLIDMTRWHTSNTRTLWLLGQWAANGNNFNPSDLEQHTRELELFANDLSRTKVLLEMSADNVIRLDHKLYEELDYLLSSRAGISYFLRQEINRPDSVSRENMAELYRCYERLVSALGDCKRRLQDAISARAIKPQQE